MDKPLFYTTCKLKNGGNYHKKQVRQLLPKLIQKGDFVADYDIDSKQNNLGTYHIWEQQCPALYDNVYIFLYYQD